MYPDMPALISGGFMNTLVFERTFANCLVLGTCVPFRGRRDICSLVIDVPARVLSFRFFA